MSSYPKIEEGLLVEGKPVYVLALTQRYRWTNFPYAFRLMDILDPTDDEDWDEDAPRVDLLELTWEKGRYTASLPHFVPCDTNVQQLMLNCKRRGVRI
jgi:hypothetical protein